MPDNQNNKREVNNQIESMGEGLLTLGQTIRSFIEFIGESTAASWECLCHPKKIRKRDLLISLNSCGADGFPITLLICLAMGVILGYQGALQMHKFGADRFLPMVVGCTIVRELGPMMVAIVATGRCGSAFAAEIATMKLSEELDALKTMGIRPVRYIFVPKLFAMLLMLPLLTVAGDMVGMFGGYMIGNLECGLTADVYLRLTREGVRIGYFFEGIIKSFVYAVLITQVGCWCGMQTGKDAIAVGRSTTSAVVFGILAVIISDSVMAKIIADLSQL